MQGGFMGCLPRLAPARKGQMVLAGMVPWHSRWGASPAVTGPGRVSVLGTWLRPIGTGTHWWRQGGPAGGLATDTGMKSPVEPGLSALGCLSPPSLGPEGSDGGWWGGPSARRTHGVPPPPCPGPEGPVGVRWDGPMPWGASPVLHRPGRVRWCLPGWSHGRIGYGLHASTHVYPSSAGQPRSPNSNDK